MIVSGGKKLMNSNNPNKKDNRLHTIQFEVHLVDHCNLNCQMCDHFSPLATPFYLEPQNFQNDISQLAYLFNGRATYIRLLGGEPLLHPQITSFFSISRKFFKDTSIELYTNGILLPNLPDSFWEAIKKEKIKICITKYPIAFDYDKLEQSLICNNVSFCYVNPDPIKTSWKLPLNLTQQQDSIENYMACNMGNDCIMLKNGILYPCTIPPNIEHFNFYFNKNVQVSQKDGINIYTAKNSQEILEFLCHPIPFCSNCNVKARTYNHKWKTSKKIITEWS